MSANTALMWASFLRFQAAKQEQDNPFKSIYLTENQQRFRDDMVEILQHRAPVMNVEPTFLPLLRRPIFVLAESQFLELFIFAAIMANVAWIGAGHFYGSMQQETGAHTHPYILSHCMDFI